MVEYDKTNNLLRNPNFINKEHWEPNSLSFASGDGDGWSVHQKLNPDGSSTGHAYLSTNRKSGGDLTQKFDFTPYIGKLVLLELYVQNPKVAVGIDWFKHNILIMAQVPQEIPTNGWGKISLEWMVPDHIVGKDIRFIARCPKCPSGANAKSWSISLPAVYAQK